MFFITPEHLAEIRARMSVQRPLHWSEALRLVSDLEWAHAVIAKLEALVPPKPAPDMKTTVVMSAKGKTIDRGD